MHRRFLTVLSATALTAGLVSCASPDIVDLNGDDGKKFGRVNCKTEEVSYDNPNKEMKMFGIEKDTWYTSNAVMKLMKESTGGPLISIWAGDLVAQVIEEACTKP